MTIERIKHVKLQPHSRVWKWLFLKEKLLLSRACGSAVDVQHFGSTAIPGMVCKPIIDILVGVPSISEAFWLKERIERLGYEFKGENSELRQYYYIKGNPEAYHLYVVQLDSKIWASRLAFRDYLRTHPDSARRYAKLKARLATQFAADLRSYQDGKAEFVRQIVLKAHSDSQTQA